MELFSAGERVRGVGKARGRRKYSGCAVMQCEITVEPGYLRADLFNRQTVEEARDALAAIAAEAGNHTPSKPLISVHTPRPFFKITQTALRLPCRPQPSPQKTPTPSH